MTRLESLRADLEKYMVSVSEYPYSDYIDDAIHDLHRAIKAQNNFDYIQFKKDKIDELKENNAVAEWKEKN